jgi:peptidoglycan/xylan/chitin deacetylase (PgdA/CDA1 family)
MKRENFKNFIYFLLNLVSAAGRLFVRLPRVAVLMYHSIGDNRAFFTVTEENFTRQLEFLKKHNYKVIFLSQLVERLIRREKLADKTVVLTFDDGYRDNFIKAWPLLKKNNFPATIFLPTDYIGRSLNNSQNVPLPILSAGQIKEMADSGLVEFGSHTQTHPRLEEISDQDFMSEARLAKETIEKLTGKNCRLFAYPRGYFKEEFFGILKGLGYAAACSIKEGLITEQGNLFLLKRNFIYSQVGLAQFRGKLTYSVIIYNWLKNIL